MADLLLHIGHVKTGTTWLQDAFRLNAARLEAAGIRYPRTGGEARAIDYDRMVPTGNGTVLTGPPQSIAPALARAVPDTRAHALFSSELLFTRMGTRDAFDYLATAARARGFERVRLLLFTRAPLPLAASIWLQRVKGWEGETRDLDAWARERFAMPERVLRFMEKAAAAEGMALTLHNYDAHRADLLAPVEAWLGLDRGSLERPPAERLNRSLTRAEAALQLALNRAMGPSQEVFAMRLTSRLPEVAPDPVTLAPETAAALLASNAAALDALDAALPPGEALDRTLPAAQAERPLALAPEQMAVIGEGIAAYLRPSLRARARRMTRRIRKRLGR